MEGFQPKHWHELNADERAKALKYLMYLKEKRNGDVKGRKCADRQSQRLYTNKQDTASPTASLAGLIITCVIDAHEKRDVSTVDIPGAFLQTKMLKNEDDVHVVLDGKIAELLAKICPDTYQKYVHHKRGQGYIYCNLNVALYGNLKAAIIFWKKLSKSLKEMVSQSTHMTDVLQTQSSTYHNAQSRIRSCFEHVFCCWSCCHPSELFR